MSQTETITTIYLPQHRRQVGLFKTYRLMVNNIMASRYLIWQLFRRDFFASYKKSLLGLSWVLIAPIVGIVSWVVMNSAGILEPGDTGVPYPAYVLLGSSLWGLFMGFYSSAAGTLSAGQSFILQVKYPHEALLVKQIAQHLANFSITFAINLIVLLLFGVTPQLTILTFPIIILPMFFIGTGLGLIISVISVVASDISQAVGMSLGFIFYLTPIVYAQKVSTPILKQAIEINPLTYAVAGVRDIILYGQIDNWDRLAIVSLVSFIFFLFAWRLFFVSEEKVIEKMI